MLSLGVDIGGSHISAGIFNHNDRKLIPQSLCHTKINSQAPKEEILESWSQTMQSSLKTIDALVEGVGLAMPGPFDYFQGISKIRDLNKLQSLYDVNLRNELSSRLKIEPSKIRFINDALAFLIAEAQVGQASQYDRVVAITLGTGLGAGFAIHARPIVRGDGVPRSGFLYNKYHNSILADELFSTRGLVNAYFKKTGVTIHNAKTLSERAQKEELEALQVFSDFGKELGEFLKPYLHSFEAESLVLGGNISKAFPFFESSLKKELHFLNSIYVSNLGEEAAIIGSALLLQEEFYVSMKEALKLM